MQSTICNSLHVSVARVILKDFVNGKLKIGDRVSEECYSKQCRVSRTPVRAALLLLKRFRALNIEPRKGARVRLDAVAAKKILSSDLLKGATNLKEVIKPTFVHVAQRIRSLFAASSCPREATIKDSAMARQLGVSRTTANRALALLAQENLVEPLSRRGWKRTLSDPNQILDLYQFRLAIEPAALESAWSKLNRSAVQDLYQRTCKAVRCTPKTKQMVKLDLELHRMIFNSCTNPFLKRAMQEQEALEWIALAPSWRVTSRSKATFQEHTAILQAILKNKRHAAIAALRSHLVNARNDTAERLRREMTSAER